ncbi:MAG: hypothetical protein RIQ53_3955 [Pseudomonadota bacterium]
MSALNDAGRLIAVRRLALTGVMLTGALAVLGGCVQAPKPLYQWGSFPRQQYEWLLREGATPQAQIEVLEAQAEKARASDGRLPPGLRAHLGLAYLSAGQPDAARAAWQAEKVAFPESTPWMDTLLKRLDAGAAPKARIQNQNQTQTQNHKPA